MHLTSLLINSFLIRRRGSPNIEMDEHTFLVNRERAVDYLNSLDKVIFFLICSYVLCLIAIFFVKLVEH